MVREGDAINATPSDILQRHADMKAVCDQACYQLIVLPSSSDGNVELSHSSSELYGVLCWLQLWNILRTRLRNSGVNSMNLRV